MAWSEGSHLVWPIKLLLCGRGFILLLRNSKESNIAFVYAVSTETIKPHKTIDQFHPLIAVSWKKPFGLVEPNPDEINKYTDQLHFLPHGPARVRGLSFTSVYFLISNQRLSLGIYRGAFKLLSEIRDGYSITMNPSRVDIKYRV